MTVESHPSTPVRFASFHAEDIDEVDNYRTMSKLAIASLLFGLVAPVCFLAPLLFAVPLIGAVVSIAALRLIAGSDGKLAGQAAATFGLTLCVATVVCALSYAYVTQHLRAKQAGEFGEQWISLLLAERLPEAFRLTVTGIQPVPPASPDEPQARQKNPYDLFTTNPAIEAIVAAGEESSVGIDRTIAYEARPRGQYTIVQDFLVTPKKTSPDANVELPPIKIALTLERSPTDGNQTPHWSVRNFQKQ